MRRDQCIGAGYLGGFGSGVSGQVHPRHRGLSSGVGRRLARDFAPAALTTAAPNVLVVHPSVPAKSVKELVALAKSRPGQLNFASSGTGTAPHLSGERFTDYIRDEIAKWAKVIRLSGAKAE